VTGRSPAAASAQRGPTGAPKAPPSWFPGARLDWRDDAGQTLIPFFFVAAVGFLAVALMLFQVGRAGSARANAQSAADAAALAAGEDVQAQLERMLLTRGSIDWGQVQDDTPRMQAAAYAERNGAELVDYRRAVGEIYVTTREKVPLGPDAERVDSADVRASAPAHAHVDLDYALSGVPGFSATGAGSGGPAGGGLSDAQIAAVERAAGVSVRSDSALRTYGADCSAGVDVVNLQPEMQVAIAKAEKLLGAPLVLNDGYRTIACQVAAAAGALNGYAAAPGRSMHNAGLAIDVANYAELARVSAKAGLCQPFPGPDEDYVHFSIADGVECGGQAGPLGAGGAYGGSASSFVDIEVRLSGLDGEGYGGL